MMQAPASPQGKFGTPLKLLAVALFVFLTGGPGVIAEGGSTPVDRFMTEPGLRSFQAIKPAAKPRQRVAAPKARTPAYRPIDAPTPPGTPVEPTFFVAVMGDSLGQMLAQGLAEGLSDRPEIAVRRKARDSSGLVRDDFLDWLQAAREIVAGPERIDFAVMMVGSNDRQSLKDAAGAYEVRSDRWREIYGQRVEDFAAIFRDKNIPLVWVGLPVMRAERMSADAIYMNDIYRERSAKAGAAYVDSWAAFVDEQGQFNPYGPDVSGQLAKLRAADGVHFTKAGALKLAHFVEGDIRRMAVKAPAPLDLADMPQVPAAPAPQAEAAAGVNLSDPDATVDANAVIRSQIRREAEAGAALPNLQASLPLPDLPQELRMPVRPVAGPIVALTAPSLAPGGVLATRGARLAAVSSEAQALIERALVDGRPLDAKPGRADDFSWPRR